MNANEYQKNALRTACDYEKALKRMCPAGHERYGDWERCRVVMINHAVLGLAGEVGEIASVMQKWIYYGKPYAEEELKAKFADEGGDCAWYLALLISAIEANMEDVFKANIEKLKVRFPDRFTEHNAADENRDRKKEELAVKTSIKPAYINVVCPKCDGIGSVQCVKCSECNGHGVLTHTTPPEGSKQSNK